MKASELLHILESMKQRKDFDNLEVYLGDDEELNGIHESYYCQIVDANNKDFEWVNENLKSGIKKYLLIS
jgi:hypothetical protein